MLAQGEDLRALVGTPARIGWTALPHVRNLNGCVERRRFVDTARSLELAIAARVLVARERAQELAAADARFRLMISLFVSGTTPLVDAVAEHGDGTDLDFETGDDALAYLRSRGVVSADAPHDCALAQIAVTEHFLIAGRIGLGSLLDLCATFLDLLERHYEVYADDDDA